jgi:type VI secretion system protein ImpL
MTILYVVLAVTLVALIVLLTVFVIHRKQEKATQVAGSGEPYSGDGSDEISSLVRDADAKLAAARIQPGARVATLPAYLIMGDSGATKTCVMLHSGLDPELIAGQVYQGGNVAPTRTANFWFSRRSVFVETGGRLPGEAAKWNKLVGRLAPKTSVVGKGEQAPRAAVVCYDIENFTKPGAIDLAAATARSRSPWVVSFRCMCFSPRPTGCRFSPSSCETSRTMRRPRFLASRCPCSKAATRACTAKRKRPG